MASLHDDLRDESSVSRLPEETQTSAVRILEYIQRCNIDRTPLPSKKLREDIKMDTHRFYPLFSWLRDNGYVQVTPNKTAKGGRAKYVSISRLGEALLEKRDKLGNIAEIAKTICRAPVGTRRMVLVQELIIEAFDLARIEIYHGGKIEPYEAFVGRLEGGLRELLDNKVGDREGLVHDVRLVIVPLPSDALLKDAELAKKRGHFLTRNHRYILKRKKGIGPEELTRHNIRWRDRIMETKFSGSESKWEFEKLIDSERIVDRESMTRNTPGLREAMRIPGENGYDYNPQWDLKVNDLVERWEKAVEKWRRKWSPKDQESTVDPHGKSFSEVLADLGRLTSSLSTSP